MKYPEDCNAARRRTEFLYETREALGLFHSVFSKWLHKGLAEEEYNQRLRMKFSLLNQMLFVRKLCSEGFIKNI